MSLYSNQEKKDLPNQVTHTHTQRKMIWWSAPSHPKQSDMITRSAFYSTVFPFAAIRSSSSSSSRWAKKKKKKKACAVKPCPDELFGLRPSKWVLHHRNLSWRNTSRQSKVHNRIHITDYTCSTVNTHTLALLSWKQTARIQSFEKSDFSEDRLRAQRNKTKTNKIAFKPISVYFKVVYTDVWTTCSMVYRIALCTVFVLN